MATLRQLQKSAVLLPYLFNLLFKLFGKYRSNKLIFHAYTNTHQFDYQIRSSLNEGIPRQTALFVQMVQEGPSEAFEGLLLFLGVFRACKSFESVLDECAQGPWVQLGWSLWDSLGGLGVVHICFSGKFMMILRNVVII